MGTADVVQFKLFTLTLPKEMEGLAGAELTSPRTLVGSLFLRKIHMPIFLNGTNIIHQRHSIFFRIKDSSQG